MKVLQINTVYKNGGSTGRIVYELKEFSEQNGIDSFVAYGYEFIQTNDEGALKIESNLELRWNILKTRLFARHGFYNIGPTKRLISYINKINPDIIHLHNIHNHYLHVGMLFNEIKRHDIPVVWTLHDCWPFTGWCAYFDYVKCMKWRVECNCCPSLHEYPYTWFIDRSRENFLEKRLFFTGVKNLIIVTPSVWLSELVKQSFLKDYPIEVINNGINTSEFFPIKNDVKKRLGIGGKKLILGMAASFKRRKGIDYLLKLSSLLNDDEHLVLVGLTIKQRASFSKKNCTGILKTNNIEELAEYYSAADVFVNPTLEDNFPTTNLESLACGTPVVTFNTGGSIEPIDETVGMIVEQGNLESLILAIRTVLKKGKLEYQNACVDKACKLFNNKKQYMCYIELYNKILLK